MEVIQRGRQGGKTTEMIEWMLQAEEGETRILVCMNEMECRRVRGLPQVTQDGRFDFDRMRIESLSAVRDGKMLGIRNAIYGLDNARHIIDQIPPEALLTGSWLPGHARIGIVAYGPR